MKNKNPENNIDPIDKLLYDLAEKNYTVIPEEIHNNIIKTIENLEVEDEPKPHRRSRIKKFKTFSFQRKIGTLITSQSKLFLITLLIILVLCTGIVGARNMSDKFFNKDTLRLNDIGIANEFVFTPELEIALKQNVPLNYVELDDNYFLSVHSLLINEVYFFTVFELHSKSGVTDNMRFIIRDLEITDENGNYIICSCKEINTNKNSGYNHIYNRENSIKELFFMFGDDNSKVKELHYSFSNIQIYEFDKKENEESPLSDINLTFEPQHITVPITKDNYNTIQEYSLENNSKDKTYNLRKVIYTNTGLHVMAITNLKSKNLLLQINQETYTPKYKLPIKRIGNEQMLVLYEYNVTNIENEKLIFYNGNNKEKYTLIPQIQK